MSRSWDDGADGTELRLLGAAVEASGAAILVTTADRGEPGPVILSANPALTRLSGYESAEAVGRTPRLLQDPDIDRAPPDRTRACLEAGGPSRARG